MKENKELEGLKAYIVQLLEQQQQLKDDLKENREELKKTLEIYTQKKIELQDIKPLDDFEEEPDNPQLTETKTKKKKKASA